MKRRCVAVLGGSFDPVHNGHVALGEHFVGLFHPDVLRIIPTGNPWQKDGLRAAPEHRVAMVELAFAQQTVPVEIDRQEIERNAPSYSIDTLRALRTELGEDTCILFLMGADQLQSLHTWHGWRELFDYAHICAATRPGFAQDAKTIPTEVAEEFRRRAGTPEKMHDAAHGFSYFATGLAIDISATAIRAALLQGDAPQSLLPRAVLDYIQQHHLYRN